MKGSRLSYTSNNGDWQPSKQNRQEERSLAAGTVQPLPEAPRRASDDVSSAALIKVEMSNRWSLSEQMAENPLANSGGASQPN